MSDEKSPRLPPELVDTIIDHLYDDKESLQACTLVCKEWVASSSLHLFAVLEWPRCSLFKRNACRRKHRGDNTLPACLQAVSTCSRLRTAVQELELSTHSTACTPGGLSKSGAHSPVVLFEILNMLPRLHTLHLHLSRFHYEPGLESARFLGSAGLRHVQLFCGVGQWEIDLSVLYTIIGKFHRISWLEISCQHPEAPYFSGAPIHVPEQLLQVEQLSIRHIDEFITDIISRLEPIVDLTSTKTLSIPLSSLIPYVSSFVERLPNLTSITYQTNGHYTPEALTRLHLQRISIWSNYFIWSTNSQELSQPSRQLSQWDDLLRDLEVLVCTNATHLELRLRLQEYGGLRVPADDVFEQLMNFLSTQDWERLGHIVQGYTSLETLRLCVSSLKTPPQRLIPALELLAFERLPKSVGSLLEISAGERVSL